MIKIDFAVDETPASLRAFLVRLNSEGSPLEGCTVDTSACQYLGPMAVAVLSGFRRRAQLDGKAIKLVPPRLEVLRAYCRYSGLLHEFGIEPAPTDFAGNNTTLTSFTALDMSAMNAVVALVKRHFKLSADADSSLRTGMVELMHNVLDHAKSPVGGLITSRAFEGERELRFAMLDMGVGFRSTLAPTTGTNSDVHALRLAVEEGKSARSTRNNMGAGLSNLQDVVNRNKGRLMIVSGRAAYELNWRGETKSARFSDWPVSLPGALAVVRFRIDNSLYDPDRPDADADAEE